MDLLFQPFDPGLDLRLGRAVQRLSGLPVDLGILRLELGIGLVDAAAAGAKHLGQSPSEYRLSIQPRAYVGSQNTYDTPTKGSAISFGRTTSVPASG